MNAVDSLNGNISESEINELGKLLDCLSEPTLLVTENRQVIYSNHAARYFYEDLDQEFCVNSLLPEIKIWNRVWARVKKGHTVTTSNDLTGESEQGNPNTIRVELCLSLLSSTSQLYAMCIFSQVDAFSVVTVNDNFGKFPEENPNPVMRISNDGRLLYANRASAPLVKHWNKASKDSVEREILAAFDQAVEVGKSGCIDVNCGDRVYSVAFAPVQGCDYLNIYALDATDKKRTEQALKSALDEVHRLKNCLQNENDYLEATIKQVHEASEIVGDSELQRKLLQKVSRVARTDATVLVLGETGTGKELVARAIHAESQRRSRSLVKVNCAALPANLIESELFGHEKGAFTGAVARKTGRFELANGGTIFLDEIGDLPLELQAKLLRVLQEGELERVGSNKTIRVDVRIIAATNRDLLESMNTREFREDLYYRLNVFPITSPPLRDRKEDIPVLAHHFLDKYSKKISKHMHDIDEAVMSKLQAYDWPGNVRELENVIERGIILTEGQFLQLDENFGFTSPKLNTKGNKTLKQVEQEMIIVALENTHWKIEGRNGAANRLGMPPSTLRERIKKYGILRPESQSGTDFYSN